MKIRLALAGCLALVLATRVSAQDAQSAYLPPTSGKNLAETIYPIPRDIVAEHLKNVKTVHVFDVFAGKNDELAEAPSDMKILIVGRGYAVDLASASLFGKGIREKDGAMFLAGITSIDAYALRILVDLSSLAPGEELWAIDPVANRSFGPYTAADALEGGRWLPTIEGNTCVLMGRSSSGATPAPVLLGVSHFFRSMADIKELSCNIHIACESDPDIQEASTGVGIMVIPSGYDQGLCSAALINNPDTPAFEPYCMTANHCVPEAISNPRNIDIVWDFRSSQCETNDAPPIGTLPRSTGESLLQTNGTLDITLLELDSVPVGALGRTYLGYTTRTPAVNEEVIGIHFPQGTAMRISYGQITDVGVGGISSYQHQNRVLWSAGVTESGSSGSPLLSNDGSLRFMGCLSNGATHSCVDPSNNWDRYSSFRHFFPEVEQWLSGTGPVDPACPLSKVYEEHPELLQNYRTVRDGFLKNSPLGQHLAEAYYKVGPYLSRLLETSPEAQEIFVVATAPLAWFGDAVAGKTALAMR
jgi:hypothetical protein